VNHLNPSVAFILDQAQIQRNEQLWLAPWLESLGHSAVVTNKPGILDAPAAPFFTPEKCLVVVGSIQFTRHFMKIHKGNCPGGYYSDERYRCTEYMHQLPQEWLLNARHVFLPFGEVCRKRGWLFELFATDEIFIRPDSGAKTFTGLVLKSDSAEQELLAIRQLTHVPDQAMTLVSAALPIEAEYRFVIINRTVISGSQYMRAGRIDIGSGVCDECLALAQRVAKCEFQVDIAYTCDIGMSDGVPKVIELNAFSTSGLYACDIKAVYQAIIEAAWLEHQGDIALGG